MMKNKLILSGLFLISILSLISCQAIGGIFKAGMWAGVIVVVLVIVLVLWLIGKMRN